MEAIGHSGFNGIGPSLEIHAYRIGMLVGARMPHSIHGTMNETRWNAFVDVATFLHFDPPLIANQRKTPVKRRCRQASDTPIGAIFEVDFGAYEIFRRCRKNLRSSPPRHAGRLAGE